MSVLEAFFGTVERYASKLPRWARIVLVVWMVVAAVYYGANQLPEMGWWGVLIGAPMILIILAVFLHMGVVVATGITAPVRWLLRKWRAAK